MSAQVIPFAPRKNDQRDDIRAGENAEAEDLLQRAGNPHDLTVSQVAHLLRKGRALGMIPPVEVQR